MARSYTQQGGGTFFMGFNENTKKVMEEQRKIGQKGGIFNLTRGALTDSIANMMIKTLVQEVNAKLRTHDKPKAKGQTGRLRIGEGEESGWEAMPFGKDSPGIAIKMKASAYRKKSRTKVIYGEFVNYGHYKRGSSKSFSQTGKKMYAEVAGAKEKSSTWIEGLHFLESASAKLSTQLPAVLAIPVAKDLRYYFEGKEGKKTSSGYDHMAERARRLAILNRE